MEKRRDLPAIGTVVKSCAGRDRKRVFIVIGVMEAKEGTRLIVANGELRSSEKPKTKNLCHVKPIAHLTEEEMILLKDADDRCIRSLVMKYDKGYQPLNGD